jgi:hypothetical protein
VNGPAIEALFSTIERHGHSIRELAFSGNHVSALYMQTVLGQLKSLTLHSQSTDYQEDENVPYVMRMLGNWCFNLRHLDLDIAEDSLGDYGLYNNDVDILLSGFKLKDTLVSLKLGDFRNECRYDKEIEHIPFIHCSLLEKLHVSGFNAEDFMTSCQLRSLKELVIGDGCSSDHLTDEEFAEAFEQRQLNSLQLLELDGFTNFGKKATAALLNCCPNLIHWSRSSSIKSEMTGFEEAVTYCGAQEIKLQTLELKSCHVNRNVIMAVASLCNLSELHFD